MTTAATPILRDEIDVPALLGESINQIVEEWCKRTGEAPVDVRRTVELEVLRRGVEATREVVGLPTAFDPNWQPGATYRGVTRCKGCGAQYEKRRGNHRFCSQQCRHLVNKKERKA